MKTKRLFMLMLILCLCVSAIAFPADASGRLDSAGPTKAEIQEKWQEVTYATSLYDQEPSVSSPYVAGALTDNFLESGITYLNYVRYVANLPAVQLSDTLNEDAQHGAVVLAANDVLTHYPEQPADMDDAFFERGYDATTSSNISARFGYAPLTCLQGAVSGCMADSGDNNLATVGHRRWLLNPTLLNVGFGYAEAESGWSYIVTKVFDRSGPAIDYDFISWPVEGNQPTNLFSPEDPWSITLNPSKYKAPSASDVKITITRQSDGKTWSFDSSTGQPTTSTNAYMVVNNMGYGISNCIIFHPGSSNIDAYDGIFTVEVSGIYNSDGSAATLTYQVDFFDVEATCLEHDYQITVTQPTCTADGYTTHTCSVCGSSYKDTYTAAKGHSFGDWSTTQAATCTAEGIQKRTCASCGASESNPIAATGHSYTSQVTAPTCTSQGYTTHTCSACGSGYKDSYTTEMGHSFGSWTTTKTATCIDNGTKMRTCASCGTSETTIIVSTGHSYTSKVTEPTCTNEGYTTHTCSVCGDSYQDSITAAKGHSYGSWTTTKAATCTAEGSQKRTCSSCSTSETKAIAATGHKYTSKVTAPTCTDQGFTTHTCSVCGNSYKDTYISTKEHSYGSWTIIKAATCTTSGTQKRTCNICSDSETKTIAATGHNYVEGVCSDCGDITLTAPVAKGANVASTGRIKISWNAVEGAVSYEIHRADSKNGTYVMQKTTTGTSYIDTDAVPGETFYYKVRVVASDGSSADSNSVGRTCDLAQPAVTVSNKASTGKIVIKWNAVEGATKYQVYRATSKNGTYTRISTTTDTSIINTKTNAGTTYYYKVKALCGVSAATSAYSSIKSRTCDLAQPTVTVSNKASTGKIVIKWNAVEGATKYQLYRATSKNGTYTRISTTTDTSIINTKTDAGTTYYYKVKALCGVSAATSAYSSIKSRTCDLPQPEVSITRSSGKPKISWEKVDGAVSYKVYRATSKNGTYTAVKTTTSLSWKDTTAKKGTTYYYKVVAVCRTSAGNSAYSGIVSIKATK